jgi:A/G-specific adenine glycosylase
MSRAKSNTMSSAISEALCDWFDDHARDLPWRRRRNGYTALVAEAMLQQTQVSRVVECFPLFIRAFPTLRRLAAAHEQQVLALWQGMGYYRRARNLHAAARMIVRDFGGRVPRTVDELLKLPGVGRYTAGAIASIVFEKREPIVDGNVERVLARLCAFGWRESAGIAKREALSEAGRRGRAWNVARELAQRAGRPGVFNESLMELGATVCLPAPAKPRCGQCPVAKWCAARRLGLQDQIPVARVRGTKTAVHHHAVIITRVRDGAVLLEQRNGDGMWSGMWQVPTIEGNRAMDASAIRQTLRTTVDAALARRGSFMHHTTHRAIRFHVYQTTSRSRTGTWRQPDALGDLPLSNAQRRVLTFIDCTSSAG